MQTLLISALALMCNCCEEWDMSILNPENEEYVIEAAFDLGVLPDEVTQAQFNERYELNR